MSKTHNYQITVIWTGNQGKGTADYKSYSRDHIIKGINKNTTIEGSSDPSFLGDKHRHNPEELFLSSLSSCHMLWYLHLCSVHNILVEEYIDKAEGTMEEAKDGSGRFTKVELQPTVVISDENMLEKAIELHHKANEMCFIANSCNFPISHKPNINIQNV